MFKYTTQAEHKPFNSLYNKPYGCVDVVKDINNYLINKIGKE